MNFLQEDNQKGLAIIALTLLGCASLYFAPAIADKVLIAIVSGISGFVTGVLSSKNGTQ